MGAQSSLKPKIALEGVHGVQVVPHSPFALEEIKQPGDFHQPSHASFPVGRRRQLTVQRVWQQRPGCLRPIRCSCHGDRTLAETIANVITSLPFIALGFLAPRKNLHCKLYANSLIGVGIVSSLYHSLRGKVRRYMRWADYTMIATATLALTSKRK
ncbi:hypothetical protein K7X08_031410 [Anisodus acutangulus]|uniref:Uncharacterized protein n=1 Tax=Anisodus acutangulus TaxID=402998 RepID=A0A9Q1MPM2_9SOLA|nr:hypothetical protein K7X08_031410 [Anisodus acutangulus]